MPNNKPTQEQIKEFAEWCNFTDIRVFAGRPGWDGVAPDGVFKAVDIDLNNLFKYAVPKLYSCELETLSNLGEEGYEAFVSYGKPLGSEGYSARDKDPALALFWAIWEMIRPNGCKECGIEEPLEREIIAHRSTSTDRNYHNDR